MAVAAWAPSSTVVIGGGVAGVAISRALATRGVKVTLLERASQLCSGATWHAAGLVTRFGGSAKLKKIHVRSLAAMCKLHEEHDIGLHLTGSIRIVEKGDFSRLAEAKQQVALAALYDDPAYPSELLPADELARRHPLLDTSRIECGLWTPHDGDVDATTLTNVLAKLAKQAGAQYVFNTEVDFVLPQKDGTFLVRSVGGEDFTADSVVNAAGLWSRRFSHALGLSHPAYVIEHQYAITEVGRPRRMCTERQGESQVGGCAPVRKGSANS
eukprot:2921989-Pleurochrysis_carterae.AAC.3